jgi:hypothetical protein
MEVNKMRRSNSPPEQFLSRVRATDVSLLSRRLLFDFFICRRGLLVLARNNMSLLPRETTRKRMIENFIVESLSREGAKGESTRAEYNEDAKNSAMRKIGHLDFYSHPATIR